MVLFFMQKPLIQVAWEIRWAFREIVSVDDVGLDVLEVFS